MYKFKITLSFDLFKEAIFLGERRFRSDLVERRFRSDLGERRF